MTTGSASSTAKTAATANHRRRGSRATTVPALPTGRLLLGKPSPPSQWPKSTPAPPSVLATASVPDTGGWGSYQSVHVPVTVAAGDHLVTVYCETGGFNLDHL